MRIISPIRGMSVQDIFQSITKQRSGSYPIGANNFWHGGIHIETDKPVVAIAPGKIIAYRITRNVLETTLKTKKYDYSNSFVLLEHSYISPKGNTLTFYSLYMHLLPIDLYEGNAKKPLHLCRIPYTVTASDQPPAGVNGAAGLHVRSSANANAAVTRVIAQNSQVYLRIIDSIWAMVLDENHPSQDTAEFVAYGGKVTENEPAQSVEQYDTVATTKLSVEAGELLGYPGVFMAKSGDRSKKLIHFEIFSDDSIRAMMKSHNTEGANFIHFSMAKSLREGKKAHSSLPDQTVTIGTGPAARKRKLKISARTKIEIVGDSGIDSKYIECQVIEMTRVVPLNTLTAPQQGDSYGIVPATFLDVVEIFDCFSLTAADRLQFRWQSTQAGERVYPLPNSQWGVFTFSVPQNRRLSVWVAKSALGDLQIKEKLLTAEITDLYLVDPEAFSFDEKIEGLSVDEYFLEDKTVHKKLDVNNKIWYEITTPYTGYNASTILKYFLEDFGIKWTPKATGWIDGSTCRELKASSWPGFKIIEESGGNASDGFCDFKNLSAEATEIFKEIDTSKDGTIDEKELEKAIKSTEQCYKLMRLICKFPSEWQADQQLSKWDRLKTIIKEQKDLDATREQIKKLIWWDEVVQLVNGFPASATVHHFHPLAFIIHISKLPYCVRQLQRNLRTLGFEFVGNADGSIGRNTRTALREFLIYARMQNVARVRNNAALLMKRSADIAAQQGESGGMSAYCDSLETVANNRRFTGPLGSPAQGEVVEIMHHWLDNNWRCPLVVEAWWVQNNNGNRVSLYKSGLKSNVNIWKYDDITVFNVAAVPNRRVKIFARDFSGYYNVSPAHANDPMYILGRYSSFAGWGGPVNLPTREIWRECEILPLNLTGQANPAGNTMSTYKVVRAVSEVECIGFFDCITAYDNAFISTGPCHWTLGLANGTSANGTVNEGELGAYLSYFAYKEPDAFKTAFSFFGLSIAEKWDDGRGDGATLVDTGRQRKYTGWIEHEDDKGVFHRIPNHVDDWHYYHSWTWFYRFQMAARTIERYRRRMWDMARMRLRDIRRSSWNANGPWGNAAANVTIGDVFTSEIAIAIIQRWHVRFPAHVISNNNAGQRLINALNRAMNYPPAPPPAAPLVWNTAPAQWGDAHEARLVQGLLDEVQSTNNQGFIDTITSVNNWPAWAPPAGANNYQYQLNAPARLSNLRNSFQFDASGLNPPPNV